MLRLFSADAAGLPDAFACCLNGAWMPSMADDVLTDRNTLRLRATGLRKYGLVAERRSLMRGVYQQLCEWELQRA